MPKPLSCAAVALQIEVRTGYKPHSSTVRRWCEEDLKRGEHYMALQRRFLVYPSTIDVLIAKRVLRNEEDL
jgi:hypothetical protein